MLQHHTNTTEEISKAKMLWYIIAFSLKFNYLGWYPTVGR